MALPINLSLYTPSFETIHQVIFSQIPNDKDKTPALKVIVFEKIDMNSENNRSMMEIIWKYLQVHVVLR